MIRDLAIELKGRNCGLGPWVAANCLVCPKTRGDGFSDEVMPLGSAARELP